MTVIIGIIGALLAVVLVAFITSSNAKEIALRASQKSAASAKPSSRIGVALIAVSSIFVIAFVASWAALIPNQQTAAVPQPGPTAVANNEWQNELFVKASAPGAVSASEAFSGPRTYYGYYGDLDRDGKNTSISKEKYTLQFAKDSALVRGQISGLATVGDKKVQRIWELQGFRREMELVLSYVTVPTEVDPDPRGIGTYYLAMSGADYTGTAVYLDCVHRIVQCPYAMADDDFDPSEAKARWPELFKRKCEKIDLTPDLVTALTC
jgi:hypothetical protein